MKVHLEDLLVYHFCTDIESQSFTQLYAKIYYQLRRVFSHQNRSKLWLSWR
jgi:hypothetical protein